MHLVGNKDAVGRKPLVAPHKASERHLLEKALQRSRLLSWEPPFPTHVFPYLLSSLKPLVAQWWAFSSITGVGRVRAEGSPWLGGKAISGASLGSGKMQPALPWAFFFPVELYQPSSGQEAVCSFLCIIKCSPGHWSLVWITWIMWNCSVKFLNSLDRR